MELGFHSLHPLMRLGLFTLMKYRRAPVPLDYLYSHFHARKDRLIAISVHM